MAATPLSSSRRHPREVLLGAQAGSVRLPVCDHYAGVEARMRKSLALQAELSAQHGTCLFDVTLDCEDGAPVGAEAEHAALIVELVRALDWSARVCPRVGVRVHAVDHPAFDADIDTIVGAVGARLTHVMLPKVESVADIERAAAALDAVGAAALPLHALIESPAALQHAFDIAAHPRVVSLSFGLMDFVSAHGGAIPAAAMTIRGQFEHPLVRRAKLEIASAAHAHGKVPSHCVVTEFRDRDAVRHAAERAANEFGYTRMWSIHPDQIESIIAAFRPPEHLIEQAADIIARAAAADWAPMSYQGRLHDRASFRYFWQVLERAHATGAPLPDSVRGEFS